MKIKFTRDCIAFGKAVKAGVVVEVPDGEEGSARYLCGVGLAEVEPSESDDLTENESIRDSD